ncbi:MAG: Uma2 family endonuclease [Thermosynechococcaceae cyanobacterium MS004]|nr:Uma2 family endonuclease [Thermosynechococcaceae cyanobacterium MS004]
MLAQSAKDLERVQAQLPDHRLELVDGEIIVMPPSGYESDEVASEFSAQLRNWVKPNKLGRVTGAGAGFNLPNANTRSPDVSFVAAARLRSSPRSFADLAPDLVVEVKSPTDSLKKLREKIQEFLSLGTQIGILIDPEQRSLELYQANQERIVLQDGDTLRLPDLLPGWSLAIAELWPLEFPE